MRSLLFVPGDSQRKLDKAIESAADALILDLEDSVSPGAKAQARETTAAFMRRMRGVEARPRLYVRVNALESGLIDDDLDILVSTRPDGIMLPKSQSGADVALLDAKIAAIEALSDIDDGSIGILAIATETAASLFALGTYSTASARLEGMTWGAEDLSADVGATTSRRSDGEYSDLYRLARSLCLAGATAAGAIPIDSVFTDLRDSDGLRRECEAAARDGFAAKMAIHPAQVPVINEVFTPSEATIAEAEAILSAFEAGGTGVTSLEGRMLDRPHLKRAERILARARGTDRPTGIR